MNRRGFTLIEALIASAILLLALSGFNLMLKTALRQIDAATRKYQALLQLRTAMESGSNVSVVPLSADLLLVEAKSAIGLRLTTLRKK